MFFDKVFFLPTGFKNVFKLCYLLNTVLLLRLTSRWTQLGNLEDMIPILDVGAISLSGPEPSHEMLKEVGDKLFEGLTKCGFVYLINYGMDQELIKGLFASMKEFFSLPAEMKGTVVWEDGVKQGYVGIGVETAGLEHDMGPELRESFDLVDPSKENSLPSQPPQMGEELLGIGLQMSQLSYILLKALALAMDLEEDFFVKCHQKFLEPGNNSYTTFRCLHYPPILSEVKPGVVRIGEHEDITTFTLLLPDSEGGLQIKSRDDGWIDAPYVENALVLNVGLVLELWTGGLLPATKHRVIVPKKEELRKKDRYCAVIFVSPENDTWVAPLDTSRIQEGIEERRHLGKWNDLAKGMDAKSFILHHLGPVYGI